MCFRLSSCKSSATFFGPSRVPLLSALENASATSADFACMQYVVNRSRIMINLNNPNNQKIIVMELDSALNTFLDNIPAQ